MVYGVLRLINFAHSDVYMFGAFMGYYLANNPWIKSNLGTSALSAVLIMLGAMVLSAGLGILIERFAYRPGRGASRFTLAFWLGILGAAAGQLMQVQRFVWHSSGAGSGIAIGLVLEKCRPASGETELASGAADHRDRRLALSRKRRTAGIRCGSEVLSRKLFRRLCWMSAPLKIDSQKVIVLGVSIVLMVLLNLIVNYTKTGKAMRAVSFNLDAAKLMGINTDRIIAFTFALGSALAAAGGILVSLLYPRIDPLMGVMPGLKAFVAAVLGGIGNITGAMLGGLILGMAEVMAVGYGQSTYRDAIAFVILVLILLLKPTGIMGKGMTEKV